MNWPIVIAAIALATVQIWLDFSKFEERLARMAREAEAKKHA